MPDVLVVGGGSKVKDMLRDLDRILGASEVESPPVFVINPNPGIGLTVRMPEEVQMTEDTGRSARFMLHGRWCTGPVVKINALTVWIKARGGCIKRHIRKHQVQFI